MPFYTSLTVFRVLSIGFVITSFGYASLPIYGVLVLGIVIIGYMKTSKEEDFVVRGLRSAITTGKNVSCYIVFQTILCQLMSATKLNASSKSTGF